MKHLPVSAFSAALGSLLLLSACQTPGNPILNLRQPVQMNRASVSAQNAQAGGPTIRVQDPSQLTVPGEIVVRYRPGLNAQSRMQIMQQFQLSSIRSIGHPEMGIELLKAPEMATQAAIEALNNNPAVLYAEPNFVVSIPQVLPGDVPQRPNPRNTYPNDEMFASQYAHQVSNSQAGWQLTRGDRRTVLAVIDTGVDSQHPDLAAKMLPGFDAITGSNDAKDEHGHGTHCAGIAAALTNNGVGIAGFAPEVSILPVRVLDARGSGTSADVAAGTIWAADNGADVISMSLGGRANPKVKEDSIKHALAKDVVVVAAMGNYGDNSKIFPAAQDGVIAVGATDDANQRARFSQYGTWISVSAPGVNILSTFPTNANNMNRRNYGSISGTSMATPAAAGVAALIRSQFPDMNREQVRAQLEQGTDDLGEPGYDIYYGHGRINVAKALTLPGRR
ncbi:MAG: peptidase S8 [Candidatus Sericytochromatia bacterium]|nr:peptidase S8 [Candidatus Sericytochromatia bacterium]